MHEAGTIGGIRYEVAGDGPAVTLLHPGLWDSRTWDPQFEPWAERFRVLRYDLRGYGRSSRLDGTPYSHVRISSPSSTTSASSGRPWSAARWAGGSRSTPR
jgi:pimeloyl-ACP methyl ester carboxylesterase